MKIKRTPGRIPVRFGPVRINTSDGRPTSVSLVLGRVSWNSRKPFKFRVDTPGPGGFELGPDRQR